MESRGKGIGFLRKKKAKRFKNITNESETDLITAEIFYASLHIELTIYFLIGRMRTVNFRNQCL